MSKYDNYNPEIFYNNDDPEKQDLSGDTINNTVEDKTVNIKSNRKIVKRKSSKSAGKQQAISKDPSISAKIREFIESGNLRLLMGIFLGGLGLYFAVSFISYLTNCFKDQALVNNSAIGEAHGISNSGGEGGARIAEFLINECFGLGSFIIILWLITMSLKLLIDRPRFKSVNFTIKSLVALITISLIIGLLTIGLNSSVNWGGYHGRYVNTFILEFVGWWGAVILCLMLIATFVVICLRDIIVWINKIRAKKKERQRIIDEERARRIEEERIIEEMKIYQQQEDIETGVVNKPVEETDTLQTTQLNFDQSDGTGLYEDIDSSDTNQLALRNVQVTNDNIEESKTSSETEENNPKLSDYVLEESTEEQKSDIAEKIDPDSNDLNIGTADEDEVECDADENAVVPENKETADGTDKTDVTDNTVNIDNPMVVNVNSIATTDKITTPWSGTEKMSADYKFPPISILREGIATVPVDEEEQLLNKEKIRKTLLDFEFPIVSISATVGPTVTLYEIRPDKGQKVSKIKSLVDDISLSLSATGVRIIAPIPGKGTIGIEVANKEPQMVSMRTIIQSLKYQESKYKLPVALGSTINNEVYIADLTKMPHMLVAGATGQGKSVGLNVIITSLLYRKKPHELKFVMIDPKMVEFSLYAKIEKHYLAKLPGEDKAIITDMSKAVATLNSLVQEMENRYELLMKIGTRNIEEYNTKWKQGLLSEKDGHRFMPYIVVIVDEFCDLIMTAGKEVEKPIARLAQKARAVGIHEIIATQRPSATVITGNIKANFLTRVAFKVSSGIDSKTILDTTGAQQLIGRGDMLISNNSEMTRVQCAFVDTPEVEALTDFVSRQPNGGGAYILPEPQVMGDIESGYGRNGGLMGAERDPLFYEIGMQVAASGYASTSNIQRQYSLGYNRAGKIMDQLEMVGIVSAAQGGKPRSVLVSPSEAEEILRPFAPGGMA
ncbi:MAG: DNA translocase FtsK [Muribaculaceae bacterium]|nr:DNA translocase FtsK [Muribaculaceae bacterium]